MNLINHYSFNPDLFIDLVIPDVPTGKMPIDKDVLISRIMMECGQLTPIYNEPDTMQSGINFWSKSKSYEWLTLWLSMQEEYNPIENYDRIEDWKEHESNAGENETKVSAYNESTYQNRDKNIMGSEDDRERHGRVHGNIGTLTSQSMITQERNIAKFDFYKYVALEFRNELMIQVY